MYKFFSTSRRILTPEKIPKHVFADACDPKKNTKIRESIHNYMKTIRHIEMSESHSAKPFIPDKNKS